LFFDPQSELKRGRRTPREVAPKYGRAVRVARRFSPLLSRVSVVILDAEFIFVFIALVHSQDRATELLLPRCRPHGTHPPCPSRTPRFECPFLLLHSPLQLPFSVRTLPFTLATIILPCRAPEGPATRCQGKATLAALRTQLTRPFLTLIVSLCSLLHPPALQHLPPQLSCPSQHTTRSWKLIRWRKRLWCFSSSPVPLWLSSTPKTVRSSHDSLTTLHFRTHHPSSPTHKRLTDQLVLCALSSRHELVFIRLKHLLASCLLLIAPISFRLDQWIWCVHSKSHRQLV